MKITSRVDSTEINVDVLPNKHYAMMLSGGLDSPILMYLMILDSQQKGFKLDIRPYTIPKDSGYLWVPKILNFLREKTNTDIPDMILLSNPDVGHRQKSTEAVREIYRLYNPDFYVQAVNQNPHELEIIAKERWGEGRYNMRVKELPDPRFFMPFLHLTKDHIVDLMFEYGLEDLMNITHTCTMQNVGRCNECFQCTERIWAFEKLGKVDTGTN